MYVITPGNIYKIFEQESKIGFVLNLNGGALYAQLRNKKPIIHGMEFIVSILINTTPKITLDITKIGNPIPPLY